MKEFLRFRLVNHKYVNGTPTTVGHKSPIKFVLSVGMTKTAPDYEHGMLRHNAQQSNRTR